MTDRKQEHRRRMAQRKARYNQMAEARRAEQAILFDENFLFSEALVEDDSKSAQIPNASVKGLKSFLLNTTGIDR